MTTLGIFARVTEQTTLGDLNLLLARFGVVDATERFDARKGIVTVVLRTTSLASMGQGATLSAAYDDAVARLVHRIGDELQGAANVQAG